MKGNYELWHCTSFLCHLTWPCTYTKKDSAKHNTSPAATTTHQERFCYANEILVMMHNWNVQLCCWVRVHALWPIITKQSVLCTISANATVWNILFGPFGVVVRLFGSIQSTSNNSRTALILNIYSPSMNSVFQDWVSQGNVFIYLYIHIYIFWAFSPHS